MSIRMGRSTKNQQAIPSIERARNFRMRIKQNPETHEAYREKERERYRRRRLNKSLKSIGDLSESEKREQREKWRISKREARAKQTFSQIVTESPSTPVTYIIRLEKADNDNCGENTGPAVTCRIKQEIGEHESSSENPGPSLTEKEVTSNFNTNKEYSPTPRKRGRPRKEGRPLTSTERQRNYRMKIKQDRESLEAYQERARNRYVIAKRKKTVKCIDDLSESEKIQQREYWRIRKRQSRRTKRHPQTISECSSPPLTYIIRQEDESVAQDSGLPNAGPLLTYQIKQEVDEESAENQENGSYIENPRTPVTCRIKQELDDEGWIANSQPLNASEVGVIQTVGECVESSPMKLNVVLHSEKPNPRWTMNETNRNQQMVSNCSPASHEIQDVVGNTKNYENVSSCPTNPAENGGTKLGTVSLCSSPQHTMPLREPDGEKSLSSTADNSDRATGIIGLTEMPTCPDKDPIALELTCDSENPQTFSDDCDDEDFEFDFHTPEPSSNDNGVNDKITLPSNVSKVKKDADRSSVKKRPLTNTERMRNYMIRIKQNPAAHKEYRRRERERNRMRRMNKSLKRIGEMSESEKRKQREKWRRLKREYRKKSEVSPIVAERSLPPLTYRVKLKIADQEDCLPDDGRSLTSKNKQKNQGLQMFGNVGPSVTTRNKSDFEEPASCIENSQSSKSAREVSGSLREATSPLIKTEAIWNCEYPELPLTMNGDLRMNQKDSNCPLPSCEIKDLVGCLENYENTSSRPANTVENGGAKLAIVSLCSSPQNMLPVLQLGGDTPGYSTADNSDKMTDIMAERSTCGQSPKIGELTCESESAETLTGNSYNLDLLRHSQTFNIHEPPSNDTGQVLIHSKVSEIQKVDEYCNNPGQLLEEEEGATMFNAAGEYSLPPPEKKAPLKKRQRPLTPAERQRNYRLRMKLSQEKGEAYRERERQRYRIRKMNKSLKSVHEMSESEKREQREKWRISQRDARKKKAVSQVVSECSLPVPECSLPPLIYRPRVRQGNRDYNGHPESWHSVKCTIGQKNEDFIEEQESCIENLQSSKSAGELCGTFGQCATSPLIKTEVVWNCENPELPLTVKGDLRKKQDFSNSSQPSCEIKEVVGYPENYENTSFHPTNIAGNDPAKLGIVSLCLSPQHTMHVLQLHGDTPGCSTADNSDKMTDIMAERSTCGKYPQTGELTCDSESTETFADKCNNSDLLLHCQTFNSHESASNDTDQVLMPSKFSEIQEMNEYCNNPGQSLEEEEGATMFNAAGEYSLPPPPAKKTSPVNKRQRPLTPAERQRNYRLRMKQNQEKDEAYREKERQRYRIRKMNKALKSIHEMSENEKREQREKWRISQRDARKKKAVSQVVPECSLPPLMYRVRQEKKDCGSFL